MLIGRSRMASKEPQPLSLATARPSSIVDCTVVWGSCCHFLQHKRRDQFNCRRFPVVIVLNQPIARQGGKSQLGDWLPKQSIETGKKCMALLQTPSAGRTQTAGRTGGGLPSLPAAKNTRPMSKSPSRPSCPAPRQPLFFPSSFFYQ